MSAEYSLKKIHALVENLMSCCRCIGYATSCNERMSHISAAKAAKEKLISAYTHPPAQAAQDAADEARDTAITDAFDAEHPFTTAEPAAQGEVVAWRRRHSSGEAAWLGWIYSEAKPKCVASATTQIEPLCRHLAAQPRAVPDGFTDTVKECVRDLRKHAKQVHDLPKLADDLRRLANRIERKLAAAPSPGESE